MTDVMLVPGRVENSIEQSSYLTREHSRKIQVEKSTSQHLHGVRIVQVWLFSFPSPFSKEEIT